MKLYRITSAERANRRNHRRYRDTGYEPQVSVEEGIDRFPDWFLEYYDGGKKLA